MPKDINLDRPSAARVYDYHLDWRPDTPGSTVDGDVVGGFCAGVGRKP